MNRNKYITIIGGGMAGSEAALQLAANGIQVRLYDRKPGKLDGAYSLPGYAELVCNNSLGPLNPQKALGMLLDELEKEGSRLIQIAKKYKMKDENAFSVDVAKFSQQVTYEITHNPLITCIEQEITELPCIDNLIIATGPLTHELLAEDIARKFDIKDFSFSDASSPVVNIEDINVFDQNIVKESEDVYSVVMTERVFSEFVARLLSGEVASNSIPQYADELVLSQPLEKLARDNFSALKNVKLSTIDNNVVIKLVRAKSLSNGFILSNCTTQLKNKWQVYAFSSLPGFSRIKLESFIRFGRLHRNTFFVTPHRLDRFFALSGQQDAYMVGQITGIDGYAAAIASGMVAAHRIIRGDKYHQIPRSMMIGALAWYVANGDVDNYVPIAPTKDLLVNP